MAERTRHCLGCAYRLDFLPEPRCPECGRRFDPADPRTFRVEPTRRRWDGFRTPGPWHWLLLLIPPVLLLFIALLLPWLRRWAAVR